MEEEKYGDRYQWIEGKLKGSERGNKGEICL